MGYRSVLSVLLGLLVLTAARCGDEAASPDFVARVGEAFLTEEDLLAAMETVPDRQDSSAVRRSLVEQWVTNELLYQEALRRDLRAREEVQRRLQESERAVLIDALVSQLYREEIESITPGEIRSYFERNKERLRLREPFVRVHYLSTTDADSAAAARRLLQRATTASTAEADWPGLVARFAEDPEGSLALSSNYVPESRLFAGRAALRQALGRLQPNQTASLIQDDEQFHVLQLVDRARAGAIPEQAWVENEVRRLLTLEARKQMYQRQVQRLRTEAQSRDALVIR